MEDKDGAQPTMCVCKLCVCVCVCLCLCDGEQGGYGWTDSMMEQFDKKCFYL